MRKTSLVSIGIVQLFIFALYGYAFFSQAATVNVNVQWSKVESGATTTPNAYPLIPHFWTGIDLHQSGFNALTLYADSLEGQGVFIYDASTLGSPPKVLSSTTTISWHNAVATADRWFIDDILTLEHKESGNKHHIWIGTQEGGAYRLVIDNQWNLEIDKHFTVKNTGCHGSASSIAGNTIQFTSIDCAYNTLCDSSSGCSYGSTQLDFTKASDLVLQLNSELHVIDGCTRSGGTGSCTYDKLNDDGNFTNAGRVNVSGFDDINKFVIRAGLGSNVVNDIAVDGNTVWFATGQLFSPSESKDGGFSRLTSDDKMESFSFATNVPGMSMTNQGPSMGTQSLHIHGDAIYIGGQSQFRAQGLLLKCETGSSSCTNYEDMLHLTACIPPACMQSFYDVVAEEIGSTLYLFTGVSMVNGGNFYSFGLPMANFIPDTFNGDGLKIMDDGFTVICHKKMPFTQRYGKFYEDIYFTSTDGATCLQSATVDDWLVARGEYYLIKEIAGNTTLKIDKKEVPTSGLNYGIFRINGNIFKEHIDTALEQGGTLQDYWPQTPYPNSLTSNRIHDIDVVTDGSGNTYVWMATDLGITVINAKNILSGNSVRLEPESLKKVFSTNYMGVDRGGEILGGWSLGSPNATCLPDNMVLSVDVRWNDTLNEFDAWVGTFGGAIHFGGTFNEITTCGNNWSNTLTAYKPVNQVVRFDSGQTEYLAVATGFKFPIAAAGEQFEALADLNAETPNKAFHEIMAYQFPFVENREEETYNTFHTRVTNLYTKAFFDATTSCTTPACAGGATADYLNWDHVEDKLDIFVYELDMVPNIHFHNFPLYMWDRMISGSDRPSYDSTAESPGNTTWEWKYWDNLIWAFLDRVENRYGRGEISKWKFTVFWEQDWPRPWKPNDGGVNLAKDVKKVYDETLEAFKKYQGDCTFGDGDCYLEFQTWNTGSNGCTSWPGSSISVVGTHGAYGNRGEDSADKLNECIGVLEDAGITDVPVDYASAGPFANPKDTSCRGCLREGHGIGNRNTLSPNFLAQAVGSVLDSGTAYSASHEIFKTGQLNLFTDGFLVTQMGTYTNVLHLQPRFFKTPKMPNPLFHGWELLSRVGDLYTHCSVSDHNTLGCLSMADSHAPNGLYHMVVMDSNTQDISYQTRTMNTVTLTMIPLDAGTYELREYKINETHGNGHFESFVNECAIDPGPCYSTTVIDYITVNANTILDNNTTVTPTAVGGTVTLNGRTVMDWSVYMAEIQGPPVLHRSDGSSDYEFDMAYDSANGAYFVYTSDGDSLFYDKWDPSIKDFLDAPVLLAEDGTDDIVNPRVAVMVLYGATDPVTLNGTTPVELDHNDIHAGSVIVDGSTYVEGNNIYFDYMDGYVYSNSGVTDAVTIYYNCSVPHVAWVLLDGDTKDVKLMIRDGDDEDFATEFTLIDGASGPDSGMDIGINPYVDDEWFHLVWTELEDSGSYNIYYHQGKIENGGTVLRGGTPYNISSSNNVDSVQPRIDVEVVWTEKAAGDHDVWGSSMTWLSNQYTETHTEVASSSGDDASFPDVKAEFFSYDNVIHGVWIENGKVMYRAAEPDYPGFDFLLGSTVVELGAVETGGEEVSLSVGPHGAAHVVYNNGGDIVYQKIKLKYDTGTDTWSYEVVSGRTVSDYDQDGTSEFPMVMAEPSGNLHFLWQNNGDYFRDSDTNTKLIYRYIRQ
jgi:hypothetical protein